MQFEGSDTDSNESEVHEESSMRENEKVINNDKQEKETEMNYQSCPRKFHNLTSYGLTVAYALQCFECSKSPVEFCNGCALHLKTMVEHVWRVSSEKYPLSLDDKLLIRQAICAGWADRVAMHIPVTSRSSDGDMKARAVRYQSLHG
ncbi:ATP-dependent RNA helicase DEAH13 [Quillaja saponaria]|uniref:ATP-dependent RNA helicase DEAH13 n=1 Tax=Quillaja saponaria TaxID=32244 RepID=A0AAD7PE92_QUISA|nr:ATP-dependent RNA helicase DEAH13 [Quillaja saponaria]